MKDALGEELKVGDYVLSISSVRGIKSLVRDRVINISPKLVKTRYRLVKGNALVKIQED